LAQRIDGSVKLCMDELSSRPGAPPKSAERELVAAILERAIQDLRHENRAIATDAQRWFCWDEPRHHFSVVHVCEYLGVDADAVRESVLHKV